MPGMSRGRSVTVRRYRPWRRRPWRRKAVLFRRAALGCYATAVLLVGLALAWSSGAWLAAAAASLAGLWCQRTAIFVAELEDQDEVKAKVDVPGD